MNNQRRSRLRKLIESLNEITEKLMVIVDDEDNYRDKIPENLELSERYTKSEEASDHLYEALSNLESAVQEIENAL